MSTRKIATVSNNFKWSNSQKLKVEKKSDH